MMMIETSSEFKNLAAALLAFQAEARGVHKDSRNPHFKNTYASLEAVVETARPGLQAVGILFTQAPGPVVNGNVSMTTMLVHAKSGEWMRSTMQVPLAKSDPQGVGSAITYSQRYALMAVLGLPPVDDDGEAASKPVPASFAHKSGSAVTINGKSVASSGNLQRELEEAIDACESVAELRNLAVARKADFEAMGPKQAADLRMVYSVKSKALEVFGEVQ